MSKKKRADANPQTTNPPSPATNFHLVLAYDGTGYVGWQNQANGLAVQQVLEQALEKLVGERVVTHGSGRTDAGVHADRQGVSFEIPSTCRPWKPRDLNRALNSVLPRDIRVMGMKFAPPKFHARFSAQAKTYRYQIHTGQIMSPFFRHFALHHPEPLNVAAMQRAAKLIVGKQNFAALSAFPRREVEDWTRTVTRCSVKRQGDFIMIHVTADGFLYKMARSIAGALLKVGAGDATLEQLQKYLQTRTRTAWIETAPAHGLFLENVRY